LAEKFLAVRLLLLEWPGSSLPQPITSNTLEVIKKIPVEFLEPGMYIHDLNADWIPHNTLRQRGKISSQANIEKIIGHGITELYIDTAKGKDLADAVTAEEVSLEMNRRMIELAEHSQRQPQDLARVPLAEEMQRAQHIHNEAKGLVNHLLGDIKQGKPLQVEQVDQLAEDLVESVFRNHDALACLGRIREKDSYLLEHSVNLAVLMSIFAKSMDFEKQFMHDAVVGAMLHDIGKILIPDEILNKPGRLTAKEFDEIRKHAEFSRQMLRETPGVSPLAITIAGQHHERLDGSGYPDGLKGAEISKPGRMVAITDVYDALTADRCYKEAIPPTGAMKKLLEWSDHHLDRNLVHRFIKCMGVYPVGSLVHLSDEKLAVVTEQSESNTLEPMVKVIYHAGDCRYLTPSVLDLARPGNQVTILRAEDPRDYGITLRPFLESP